MDQVDPPNAPLSGSHLGLIYPRLALLGQLLPGHFRVQTWSVRGSQVWRNLLRGCNDLLQPHLRLLQPPNQFKTAQPQSPADSPVRRLVRAGPQSGVTAEQADSGEPVQAPDSKRAAQLRLRVELAF